MGVAVDISMETVPWLPIVSMETVPCLVTTNMENNCWLPYHANALELHVPH